MNGSHHHDTPFNGTLYADRINAAQDCLENVERAIRGLSLTEYVRGVGEVPVLAPPKIVVLGTKEVGKSSLIYSLAHIPITRRIPTFCPVEIQLQRRTIEVQWKCVVSHWKLVNFQWALDGSKETTDIQTVQDLLEEAQKSVQEWGQLKTPTSVIRIAIFGAGLDLTLLDLPALDFVP